MRNCCNLFLTFGFILSYLNTYAQCDHNLSVSDVVCWADSYTFPDGTIATNIISQVVHRSDLQTVHTSCDSTITTTVDPLPYNYRSEDLYGICPGEVYTFADGTIDTIWAHTEYISYLQTVHTGCDSIVETILNTTDMDLSVSVNGNILTSAQGNAGHQWVDCDNGFSPIPGATGQTYMASVGNYAVVIFKGSCTDTSSCHRVLTVGLDHITDNVIAIYPNPTTQQISVKLDRSYEYATIVVRNALGQQVATHSFENAAQLSLTLPTANGIYLLQLKGSVNLQASYRIVKQ